MRGRLVMLAGAACMAGGAIAPWASIYLRSIEGLGGDTIHTTGTSSGAAGWVLFPLTVVVVIFSLLYATGVSPGAGRAVVAAAAAALAWTAYRGVLLARRVADVDQPAFNTEASLSWGLWLYAAGCVVVIVAGAMARRVWSSEDGDEASSTIESTWAPSRED